MEFILPDSVMNILSRLETDGFSAFVADYGQNSA